MKKKLIKRTKIIRLLPELNFGGVESRVILQSKLIDTDEFEFRVCTFWKDGDAADQLRDLGVPVDVLNVDPSVRNPRATLALAKYLYKRRPDILHASISEANWHGAIASKLIGIKGRIVEEVGVPNRSRGGQIAFGAMYHLANRVVGVSQATCNIVLNEGASEQKVKLIYNCANPKYFNTVSPHRSAPPPLKFVAIGRLVPVKNHLNLLRAFRGVVDQETDVRLQIIGEGPLKDELLKEIETLDLASHVELLGFRNDIIDILHSAHVYLLPSWSEGCSISLIEAMTTGIAVLGSTNEGIGEVLGELASEYQVAPDDISGWTDAMLRLIRMPETERQQLGNIAKEIAYNKFSPAKYNDNVSNLYRSLLDSPNIN